MKKLLTSFDVLNLSTLSSAKNSRVRQIDGDDWGRKILKVFSEYPKKLVIIFMQFFRGRQK